VGALFEFYGGCVCCVILFVVVHEFWILNLEFLRCMVLGLFQSIVEVFGLVVRVELRQRGWFLVGLGW